MSESGKPSCARHYLAQQLDMLPNATVVAFGGKAQHYVKHLRVEHLARMPLHLQVRTTSLLVLAGNASLRQLKSTDKCGPAGVLPDPPERHQR